MEMEMEMKMILGELKRKPKNDPTLINVLTKAHMILDRLTNVEKMNISALAKIEGVSLTYVSKNLRISALSPKIQEAIITGQ